MKRVFIIGASILQLPAILKAKEMGLYVGVADYNPNAIGVKFADEFFNVSTIDEIGIFESTKKFKADGILTLATDMPMRSLAYTCERLGLVGINYETAIKTTDKLEMIKTFQKCNVAHPWFYGVDDTLNLDDVKDNIEYPCITKPVDNSGSRGVMLVHDANELQQAVSYSSINGRNGKVIIEELLLGDEVSVEVIVYRGIVHIIQITDKLTTGAPHFVETGHSQPSKLNHIEIESIKNLAKDAVLAVGINNGAAHVEIMLTKEGPKVIELGARLGGDCITTHLVPLSTGIDMVKAIIDISLGNKPDLNNKWKKAAAIKFISSTSGIIENIQGITNARILDGIVDVTLLKETGDYISEIENSTDRLGYVISQSDSLSEALNLTEKALKKINIKMKRAKKILFLGGFSQMVDVVKTANSMGLYTIVVDRDPTSPAKIVANKSYDISTDKIFDLIQICKKERIDGVFNGFEDFNVHIACDLCKELRLPFYANAKQLEIATNKEQFKKECIKNEIEVIKKFTLEEAINKKEYPYIVKPVDSYGSRGISICYTDTELKKGFENALKHSTSKNVIIEEYIECDCGSELFYTIVNGHIHLSATADRYTDKTGKNSVPLPVAEVFPSKYENEIKQSLDKKTKKMLSSLNIQNGLISIQTLNKNNKFFPYEMAYRFTGEQHYQLIKEQHGYDLSKMMLKFSLNENISEYDTENIDHDKFTKSAINLAILLNPGRIGRIEGLEWIDKIPDVVSYIITHKENDIVEDRGDYSRILMRINIVSKNINEMIRVVDEIQKNISVISESGENMILSNFCLKK